MKDKSDPKDVLDAHKLLMAFRELRVLNSLTPRERAIMAEEMERPENQPPPPVEPKP
jgi:hypothetical protein